jgi:hypothetical protein
MNDELHQSLQSLDNSDLRPILQTLIDKFGSGATQMQLALLQNNNVLPENVFRSQTVSALHLPEPEEIQRLWKMGLYPGTVTLFIGETGTGKSSLLYNMMLSAAKEKPIFGVEWARNRPLKVLYLDPENSGQTCLLRLNRIGQGRPENLYFCAGEWVNLSDSVQMQALTNFIAQEGFDIVVLDPIVNLFDTKNENDNSEAVRQMVSLNRLSRETGVCVIAVHHTGREDKGIYGRGATARLSSSDVAFMVRARGIHDEESHDDTFSGVMQPREDVIRLQIVKNRIEGRSSLYLQMAGQDRFLRSSFAAWVEAGQKKTDESRVALVKEDILAILSDGNWRTRPELFACTAQEGYGQAVTDAGIRALVHQGTLASRLNSGMVSYTLSAYLLHGGSGAPITEVGEHGDWN